MMLPIPCLPPSPDLTIHGVSLGGWSQAAPLEAEIVGADGLARWLAADYARVGGGAAEATLATPAGTRLRVSDAYRMAPDGFTVKRKVRVLAVGKGEAAFSTRFSLASAGKIREREFFMPGVWYRRNDGVPPGALASDPGDRNVLVREDRLPLPVAMSRDPQSGATLEMAHLRPDGATFAGEDLKPRIVDGRMRFGSVGIVDCGLPIAIHNPQSTIALAFQFPGSEGDRTGVGGRAKEWSLRSHPLRVGFEQSYELRVTLGTSRDFAGAAQAAWRRAFDEADPRPPKVDLGKVYRASMDLLKRYGVRYEGVPSMPFQARLPAGNVVDTSSQMGFVGKALTCAALMLRDAADRKDAGLRQQAVDLVDFWVENSMNPSGVPKTWYDIHPGGRVTWRDYPTHLRIAGDGMRGVLDAYRIEPKPSWLAYARKYGDFLVARQAADGSLAGRWKWDGSVDRPFKNATDHAIPFLVELYGITRDERYRKAALQAGEYCYTTVHEAYAYVGGTADNPNVLDKEAGALAMQAFLALYDLTKDRRWVAPAAQAGTFCETWTYAWNVPIPPGDPKAVYPRNRTTLGVSLIATGHSGADDFMALTAYDYYRLYLLTKDPHFLRFARFVMHATKQLLDWDGKLGYAYPGLLMEALNLPPPRGHGVYGWLPWLTAGVLDPMVRMRQAFGTDDIDRIDRLPFSERLRRAGILDDSAGR